MKLAFLLFLSLSALLCSALHGSAASSGCPAIGRGAIDQNIAATLGTGSMTGSTDEKGPSNMDIVPHLSHCAAGYPAIRGATIEMPAAERETIRLLCEPTVRGRFGDRLERPPRRDVS